MKEGRKGEESGRREGWIRKEGGGDKDRGEREGKRRWGERERIGKEGRNLDHELRRFPWKPPWVNHAGS